MQAYLVAYQAASGGEDAVFCSCKASVVGMLIKTDVSSKDIMVSSVCKDFLEFLLGISGGVTFRFLVGVLIFKKR